MSRKIEFMGWTTEAPKREKADRQLDEHDILRMVLIAEDCPNKWAVFKCIDRMHAIKVAHRVRQYRFNVMVVAHNDRVYIASFDD